MSDESVKTGMSLMLFVNGNRDDNFASECEITSRGKMLKIDRNSIFRIARAVQHVTSVNINVTPEGSKTVYKITATPSEDNKSWKVKRGNKTWNHKRKTANKSAKNMDRDNGQDIFSLINFAVGKDALELVVSKTQPTRKAKSAAHQKALDEKAAAYAAYKAAIAAEKTAAKS